MCVLKISYSSLLEPKAELKERVNVARSPETRLQWVVSVARSVSAGCVNGQMSPYEVTMCLFL